ncbi:MAG: phage tail tube protein [Sporomusa sp.]
MPLAFDNIPIHGKEGSVTAVINGSVVELAEVKTLTANIEFNKESYNALGVRATLHKSAGWTGTGSITYHWVSRRFVKMAIDAANSGKMPYFTINVTNDDPGSSAGRQTIKLGQVSIDGADIAQIDVDNTMLEGSFDFTFSEISGLEYFNEF